MLRVRKNYGLTNIGKNIIVLNNNNLNNYYEFKEY